MIKFKFLAKDLLGENLGGKKLTKLIFVLALLLVAGSASAHQPRLIYGDNAPAGHVQITSPDISQAFYGELVGQPQVFELHLSSPLKFYWTILVPDLLGAREDFKVDLFSLQSSTTISRLDSGGQFWAKFYEEYAGDNYFKGPEETRDLPAGDYLITVTNGGNQGKYVLAVGQTESFTPAGMWQTFWAMPSLQQDFFGKSFWQIYNNKVGQYAGVFLLIGLFLLWLLAWWLGRWAWWWFLGISAVVLMIWFGWFVVSFFNGPENVWRCEDGQWVKHGQPVGITPRGECLTPLGLEAKQRAAAEQAAPVVATSSQTEATSSSALTPAVSSLVRQYLETNLVNLSPVKAEAGQVFVISSLQFIDNHSGLVTYGDGQTVLKASFHFTIDPPEDVRMIDFQILD
jgi:hypothetical protein